MTPDAIVSQAGAQETAAVSRETQRNEASAEIGSGADWGTSTVRSAGRTAIDYGDQDVRRRARNAAPTRGATKKHVILFLAANPSGTDRRALDQEARSIRAELKRSGDRDRFDFQTRWAAEPLDLLRELRELKPTVVHFSGHGGAHRAGEGPGLYFRDVAGRAQMVAPQAIAQTFEAAGASVKLVVLNACFTEPVAAALLAHVDCVVGTSGSIHDDAARSFAIGFYGGMGEHVSIAAAVKQGRAAISLAGHPGTERPRLDVRDGCDATRLILTDVAPNVRLVVPCPYPGMRPYTADEAGGFHGRKREIKELLGLLSTDFRGPPGRKKSRPAQRPRDRPPGRRPAVTDRN